MSAAPAPIDLSADGIAVRSPIRVREAAKAALESGATHYTDRPGMHRLREAVALKLCEVNGIAVAPDDEVLITCGVEEGLFLAIRSLVGPGDEVIVIGPALPSDVEIVRMVGALPRIALPDEELLPDVDCVEGLAGPRTRMILLRSPSPVGHQPSESDLERIGSIVVRRDLRVTAIESGESFTASGTEHRSIAAIGGLGPRTVTINGFVSAGLDAWRVGYLAAQRHLMAPIRRLKHELSICSPAVSQHAALSAIGQLGAYSAAMQDQLDMRRVALSGVLACTGLEYLVPDAGVYAFVKLPSQLSTIGAMELALRRAGVAVAPGETVGAPGWIRLTLAHEPRVLGEAARRLGGVLVEGQAGAES